MNSDNLLHKEGAQPPEKRAIQNASPAVRDALRGSYSLATNKTCVCTLQGYLILLKFWRFIPLRFVATGGRDSCAKLWLMNADFAVATCVWTMELASRCAFCVHTLALHSTEPFLAIGCSEEGSSGLVKIRRLYTDCIAPTCVCTLQVDQRGDGVESVAFHPTAPYVLTGGSDGCAKLWLLNADFTSATCVSTMQASERSADTRYSATSFVCPMFYPSAPFILTGCSVGAVNLWR